MTQLFFDNASTLLGVLAAVFNMTAFGVPLNIINEVRHDHRDVNVDSSWMRAISCSIPEGWAGGAL